MLPDWMTLEDWNAELKDLLENKSSEFKGIFDKTIKKYKDLGSILSAYPERTEDTSSYIEVSSIFDVLNEPQKQYDSTLVEHGMGTNENLYHSVFKGIKHHPFSKYKLNPYTVLDSLATAASSWIDNLGYVADLNGSGNDSFDWAADKLEKGFSFALEKCNEDVTKLYYNVGSDIVNLLSFLDEKYTEGGVTAENAYKLEGLEKKISSLWDSFYSTYEDFMSYATAAKNLHELGLISKSFIYNLADINGDIKSTFKEIQRYDIGIMDIINGLKKTHKF